MNILVNIFLMFMAFSAGAIVAGGIFSFIAAIGIVPRMAQRTGTVKFIPFYEDAITIGGMFGTTTMFVNYYIPIGSIMVGVLAFCTGVFVGCLAVALAEVLNVMPIFLRRARITKGLPIIVLAIAIGKVIGSIVYFCVQGFYVL